MHIVQIRKKTQTDYGRYDKYYYHLIYYETIILYNVRGVESSLMEIDVN